MRFELEQRYSAPLDAVEAAFVDPALLEHLGSLPHLGRPELLELSDRGDSVRLRVRYTFRARLSAAVTAVIDPDRLSWVEDSLLDRGTHTTEFEILPDHYPDRLRCRGTVSLYEALGMTRRVTEADLQVRAVLVAGKVERAIVSGLHDHAAAEAAAVQEWLDQKAAPATR